MSLQWIRRPRQRRSQETLERILDAAESLIAERGVEQLTVAETARRADSSVGSLYARFHDKEALLSSVFERFYEQAVATAEHVFDPSRWKGVSTTALVRSAIALMLRIFRERRRLIASFSIRASRSEGLCALGDRLGNEVAHRVYDLFRIREEPFGHPDPELAVRFTVLIVLSALEARALYSPETLQRMPEAVVATELTHMAFAYLGLPFEPTPDTTARYLPGGRA